MPVSSIFLSMVLLMLSLCAQAASPAGMHFSHHDWELACDNTRTCRAAGYNSDSERFAVSVLLTRKAGPRQPIMGELMIGQYGKNDALEKALAKLPPEFKLSMRINERLVGQVVMDKVSLLVNLPAKQVTALLAAISGDTNIEWVIGEHSWHLSDKGAAAVLLKMDEFQGRVGTQGAIFKKGSKDESRVLPPLPIPVVIAAALAKPQPGDDQLATKNSKALLKALAAPDKNNDCAMLTEDKPAEAKLLVSRLTSTKMLVSTTCWSGAYNVGEGYWVIDDTAPYHPVLVTTSGSEYGDGRISASHKGRGLGDCWSSAQWTWNGNQFVQTELSSTGMCKLLAPGGAWSLPTLVTDVRN